MSDINPAPTPNCDRGNETGWKVGLSRLVPPCASNWRLWGWWYDSYELSWSSGLFGSAWAIGSSWRKANLRQIRGQRSDKWHRLRSAWVLTANGCQMQNKRRWASRATLYHY